VEQGFRQSGEAATTYKRTNSGAGDRYWSPVDPPPARDIFTR
jgi:hypothetical protein